MTPDGRSLFLEEILRGGEYAAYNVRVAGHGYEKLRRMFGSGNWNLTFEPGYCVKGLGECIRGVDGLATDEAVLFMAASGWDIDFSLRHAVLRDGPGHDRAFVGVYDVKRRDWAYEDRSRGK